MTNFVDKEEQRRLLYMVAVDATYAGAALIEANQGDHQIRLDLVEAIDQAKSMRTAESFEDEACYALVDRVQSATDEALAFLDELLGQKIEELAPRAYLVIEDEAVASSTRIEIEEVLDEMRSAQENRLSLQFFFLLQTIEGLLADPQGAGSQ